MVDINKVESLRYSPKGIPIIVIQHKLYSPTH